MSRFTRSSFLNTGLLLLTTKQVLGSVFKKNLQEVLKNAYWNEAASGVLLAIDPENVWSLQDMPDLPERGYTLANVLPAFEYRLFPTPTVTAIAPTKMRVFTHPTISVDDAIASGKEGAFLALCGTFTAGQWKQIGSKEGMGMADFSERQQRLYALLLPKTGKLIPAFRAAYADGSEDADKIPRPPEITLTPQQISQMRLRIARIPSIGYLTEGQKEDGQGGYFNFPSTMVNEGAEYNLSAPEDDPYLDRNNPLADTMYPKTPNKLKSSDLDYKNVRLNPEVPLKTIKTVGDLVRGVGKSTNLALAVDQHVDTLPLYLRGGSARAGDLLEALCLALMGTFRKMPDGSYLLTESLEGLGTRMTVYQRWKQEVWRDTNREKRAEAMVKNGFSLTTEDPFGFSPELKEKLASSSFPLVVDTKTLPQALQKEIQTYTGKEVGNTPQEVIRTDKVAIPLNIQVFFIVPQVGQVHTTLTKAAQKFPQHKSVRSPFIEQDLPPFTMPTEWKNRALALQAETVEEATKAVRIAQTYGFSQLWLSVPPGASVATPLLEAAIATGQANHIRVGALCNLLQQGFAQKSTFTQDIDIFGADFLESKNPFSPSKTIQIPNDLAPSPRNLLILSQQLTSIAKIKNIHALVVQIDKPESYSDYYTRADHPTGYHDQNRLDYLKKAKLDPIDIAPVSYMQAPFPIPYFGKEQNAPADLSKNWHDFLVAQFALVHPSLFNALKTAAPSLPLYYVFRRQNLVVRWNKAEMKEPVAPFKVGQNYNLVTATLARKSSPEPTAEFWHLVTPQTWVLSAERWRYSLCWEAKYDSEIPFLTGLSMSLLGKTPEEVTVYLDTFQKLQNK
jgi:hypothetical protein